LKERSVWPRREGRKHTQVTISRRKEVKENAGDEE